MMCTNTENAGMLNTYQEVRLYYYFSRLFGETSETRDILKTMIGGIEAYLASSTLI